MNLRRSMRWSAALLAVLWAAMVWTRPAQSGTTKLGNKPAIPWSPAPFDYFQNSWQVIGLKDYQEGTRVTPENELVLADKTKLRVSYGQPLRPLSHEQTKTLLEGWLPVILLHAWAEGVDYEFTLWATPLPTVKNWRAAFDWPTEGENFLNWIKVVATNLGDSATEACVELDQISTNSLMALAHWRAPLAGHKSATTCFRVPFGAQFKVGGAEGGTTAAKASAGLAKPTLSRRPEPTQKIPMGRATFDHANPKVWLDRTVRFWRQLLDRSARIEVPCEKSVQALRAAHVCQLIASDHGELHAGEGFYDEFYIRDGAYQLLELEEAGLGEAAHRALDAYLHAQRPDGRFESQKDQFDANGQALWALWQYWKITGDRRWLRQVYPQMYRAVQWIQQARRQAPADSPYAGLLPAAPADGEYLWDGKHHIVGYDFWNLRGLLCAEDAARALSEQADAQAIAAEVADYRRAIDAAWKRTGLPHFPPSWEKAGTHWGDTETLWPTELFARDDPRVTALLHEVRQRHGGGFWEGTIRWTGAPEVIHPYLSSYTTMDSLIRGEQERFVEEYYWYLLHSTATHAFPEGIYFKRRYAWNETIPHATGAANFAFMLRHALLHERGDELHLLLGVPDWWLGPGQQIRIEKAPTHFGPMSLWVRGNRAGVEVKLDPPRRQSPKRIVLHLPQSRPATLVPKSVTVETRADQSRRWDFPTVVGKYRAALP